MLHWRGESKSEEGLRKEGGDRGGGKGEAREAHGRHDNGSCRDFDDMSIDEEDRRGASSSLAGPRSPVSPAMDHPTYVPAAHFGVGEEGKGRRGGGAKSIRLKPMEERENLMQRVKLLEQSLSQLGGGGSPLNNSLMSSSSSDLKVKCHYGEDVRGALHDHLLNLKLNRRSPASCKRLFKSLPPTLRLCVLFG